MGLPCWLVSRHTFLVLRPTSHDFPNHLRKVTILQLMNLLCQGLRGVDWRNGTFRLENNLPFIITFINIMNGNPRFSLAGRDHCFMHLHPIHAFAAIFRKQGGMDVDNPARVCRQNIPRDEPQKTRQDERVDFLCFQQVGDPAGFVKISAAENHGGNSQYFSARKNICIGLVA